MAFVPYSPPVTYKRPTGKSKSQTKRHGSTSHGQSPIYDYRWQYIFAIDEVHYVRSNG